MADEQKRPEYGVDDMTFSLNDNSARKTEDWHSDWSGKVSINGEYYYLNGYRKNDTWIAGKLKAAPKPESKPNGAAPPPMKNDDTIDDDIPF